MAKNPTLLGNFRLYHWSMGSSFDSQMRFDRRSRKRALSVRVLATLMLLTACVWGSLSPLIGIANASEGEQALQQSMWIDDSWQSDQEFAYGVNAQLLGQPITPLLNATVSLRLGWIRQTIRWEDIEASPGKRDWSLLDRIVENTFARRIHLLLVIEGTPDWALPLGANLDYDGPPADMSAFSDFIFELATRYAGRISAYQIWQVPNVVAHWQTVGSDDVYLASPEVYVQLLRTAFLAIRTASPHALIVSAGLKANEGVDSRYSMQDTEFLHRIFQANGELWLDVIGVNLIDSDLTADCVEENCLSQIDSLFEIQKHINKPIWFTRVGWACASAEVTSRTEQEQAEFLVNVFKLAQQTPYVEAVIVENLNFAVSDPAGERAAYSLIRKDWSARPALTRLAEMQQVQFISDQGVPIVSQLRRAPQSGQKPYLSQPS